MGEIVVLEERSVPAVAPPKELRDEFAAEFGPHLIDRAVTTLVREKKATEVLTEGQIAATVATWAYILADAMLEARKR